MIALLILTAMFGIGIQFQDLHKVCEDTSYESKECNIHKKLEDLNKKHSSK